MYIEFMKKLKFINDIEIINLFNNHICCNILRLCGITYNINF